MATTSTSTGPATTRNVALVGHSGSGKTTLAEAFLHRAGAIPRAGSVAEGTTVCDHEPEEVARGISVSLGVAHLDWQAPDGVTHQVTLLDTPGSPDFAGSVDAALAVADLAVVVVSAVDGVQSGTEEVWRRCDEAGIPRLVVVSQEDRARASFRTVLGALRGALDAPFVPLELPARRGAVAARRGRRPHRARPGVRRRRAHPRGGRPRGRARRGARPARRGRGGDRHARRRPARGVPRGRRARGRGPRAHARARGAHGRRRARAARVGGDGRRRRPRARPRVRARAVARRPRGRRRAARRRGVGRRRRLPVGARDHGGRGRPDGGRARARLPDGRRPVRGPGVGVQGALGVGRDGRPAREHRDRR